MFKDVTELKAFIQWAKAEQIQSVQVGDVAVVFSNLAMVDALSLSSHNAPARANGSIELTSEQLAKEEEDLLYHSAN